MPISTPQQAGVALRALEFGRLSPVHVIRWSDNAIAREEKSPDWLLDLSLLNPSRFDDMVHLLHQHAPHMATRELDVCILAHLYFSAQISISELFQRAFLACILEYDTSKSEPFDRLADVLCVWDQLDFPDLNLGDWHQRASEALVECQHVCGELHEFVSELYAPSPMHRADA